MTKWNNKLEFTPLMSLSVFTMFLLMPVLINLVKTRREITASHASQRTPTPTPRVYPLKY